MSHYLDDQLILLFSKALEREWRGGKESSCHQLMRRHRDWKRAKGL